MKVQRVRMVSFTVHGDTTVELPERGLVLFTGHNGSGKSSVLEAIAHAGWNESLRDEPGWVDGRNSGIALYTDALTIVRNRKSSGGTPSLTWQETGQTGTEFATNTKAQESLQSRIGTFEAWRRTHVFSSSDGVTFAATRDSDRKRLLEEFLGLDLDPALKACRKDIHEQTAKLAKLESDARVLMERVVGIDRGIEQMRAALAEMAPSGALPDIDAMRAEAEKLRGQVAAAEAEVARLASLDAKLELGKLQGEANRLKCVLAQLSLDSECPECEQPIDANHLAAMRIMANEAQIAAEQKAREVAELEADRAAELEEAREIASALQQRYLTLVEQGRAAVQAQTAAAEREAARASGQQRIDAALAERSKVAEEQVACVEARLAAKDELEVLRACERVLGTTGVRAHILGRSLSGVEAVANARLSQIAGAGWGIQLRPITETKTGVTDKISLRVQNPRRAWHSYKAASAGERRRFDLALVLGFAALLGGDGTGTLWFDEALDSVDRDTVPRVCAVLRELAIDRCVVVITHSDDLVAQLRPDRHYNFDGGIATVK